MKPMLAFCCFLAATAAQAHESLVPHTHPHGPSLLPDLDTLVVGGILMVAALLAAYLKFGRS